MLITFTVVNFRSIRDEAMLDLRARRRTGTSIHPWDGNLAPVAAIYGPNASGKSALLSALGTVSHLVRDSYRNLRRPNLRTAFALDDVSRECPTVFDIEFIADDGHRYGYTVIVDDRIVVREELYLYRTARPTLLFDRVSDSASSYGIDDAPSGIKFGAALTGPNKSVENTLRPDALYLSAAAAAGHPGLEAPIRWLVDGLSCYNTIGYHSGLADVFDRMDADHAHRSKILDVLRATDLGVTGGTTTRRELTETELADRRRIVQALADPKEEFDVAADEVDLTLTHRGVDGDYPLPFYIESDGTQALVTHADAIVTAIHRGAVCVFDEIDSSLHPDVVRYLVALFTDVRTNPKQAQLVFTTHDVSLLAPTSGEAPLAREHVWFMEKDRDGVSGLYPATDFDVRKTDNLMRGYLTGRFGALPDIGSPVAGEERELQG